MGQLFAVVTSWHPQLRDQSVSRYTQTVVAQNMVESCCGRLENRCMTHSFASLSSQLLRKCSHHRFQDVPNAQEILVSFNLHMYAWQIGQSCQPRMSQVSTRLANLRISAINDVPKG